MQKDLKIGMALGLILAVGAAVWLTGRSSLSIESTMPLSSNMSHQQLPVEQPRFVTNLPGTWPPETSAKTRYERYKATDSTTHYRRQKIRAQKFYIVCQGDTLSGIAKRYYGSTKEAGKIYNANRNVIKDINNIRPGTKLIIPE